MPSAKHDMTGSNRGDGYLSSEPATFSFRVLDPGLGLGRVEPKPIHKVVKDIYQRPELPPLNVPQHDDPVFGNRSKDTQNPVAVDALQSLEFSSKPDIQQQSRLLPPIQKSKLISGNSRKKSAGRGSANSQSGLGSPKRDQRSNSAPIVSDKGIIESLIYKLFASAIDLVAVTITILGATLGLRLIAPAQTAEIFAAMKSPIWQTMFGLGLAVAVFSIIVLAYFLIFRLFVGRTIGQMVLGWASVQPDKNPGNALGQGLYGFSNFDGESEVIANVKNWPNH